MRRWAMIAERAGDLHAGRAAADDDEGQPLAASSGVGVALGLLERAEDAGAQVDGVVERLQPEGDAPRHSSLPK